MDYVLWVRELSVSRTKEKKWGEERNRCNMTGWKKYFERFNKSARKVFFCVCSSSCLLRLFVSTVGRAHFEMRENSKVVKFCENLPSTFNARNSFAICVLLVLAASRCWRLFEFQADEIFHAFQNIFSKLLRFLFSGWLELKNSLNFVSFSSGREEKKFGRLKRSRVSNKNNFDDDDDRPILMRFCFYFALQNEFNSFFVRCSTFYFSSISFVNWTTQKNDDNDPVRMDGWLGWRWSMVWRNGTGTQIDFIPLFISFASLALLIQFSTMKLKWKYFSKGKKNCSIFHLFLIVHRCRRWIANWNGKWKKRVFIILFRLFQLFSFHTAIEHFTQSLTDEAIVSTFFTSSLKQQTSFMSEKKGEK